MTYFIFNSKSKEELDKVRNDATLKKAYSTIVEWDDHIMIDVAKAKTTDKNHNINTYILLKYSNILVQPSSLFKDNSPIIGVDYMPVRPK